MSNKIQDLSDVYFEKPKRTLTWSGLRVKECYTPQDMKEIDYVKEVADPGQYPFTRGIYPDMYRSRYWTRREVSGFGTPADTNKWLKRQMAEGVSGLNVIFDQPTSLHLEPDHPLAEGEIGVTGVPMFSLRNMEELFKGIPLDKVSTSFAESVGVATAFVLSSYIAVGEKQGLKPSDLRGTIQNDGLHTRYCGLEPSSPLDLGVKIVGDIIEYCTRYMPLWHPINVNFYDLREQGINAVQEVAFGFSMAICYIEEALSRGLDIDEFAPRFGFYCSAQIDFLEEIAKLRAARKMWARIIKERYGAKDPRSWRFRFGIHTAGCSLVPQQLLNNSIRVAYEAMAGVLAGCQSLHCCAYDEPVALPSEHASRLTLRTQQILAYETGVANVADPLGGSYYLENLTKKIEEEACSILEQIEEMGGITEAIKTRWLDNEMENAAAQYQRDVEKRERIIVGVNAFTSPEEEKTPGGVHRVPPDTERIEKEKIIRLRETRDKDLWREKIDRLRAEAEKGKKHNLIPAVIGAVKADATIAEVAGAIREAYDLNHNCLAI